MADRVRVSFLGGLGEIGRNCAVVEQGGRLVVLDCGVMFPNPEMPGVDLVLPDFGWLFERAADVDGVVLTHGHEDHVGALAYFLRQVPVPIYGSPFTLGIARNRLDEANLASSTTFIPVADGERRTIGPFEVEFIPVTHSVPFGFALAFHTAQGVILHTGDFKLDLTPVDGRRTDLARIGQIASTDGIRLLLADSTNAEEPGYTGSESSVGASLRPIFMGNRQSRIIVACFASHIHRIQQVADAAVGERAPHRPAGPLHAEERRCRPRARLAARARQRLHRDREDRGRRPRASLHHLDGIRRASPCRLSRSWPRARAAGWR